MAIDLRKFTYKVRCDIVGCKNMAIHSIGDERQPNGTRFNICGECYQQIVLAAPQEMILKRADIAEIVEMLSDAPPKDAESNIDYDNMGMKQLRNIAKAKGHPIPVGFTKEQAVTMIKNMKAGE